MASRKCKICGKFGVLTQEGICAACKTLKIYEDKDEELSKEIEEEYDPTLSEKIMKDFETLVSNGVESGKKEKPPIKNPLVQQKQDFLRYLNLSEEEKPTFILNRLCEKYKYDGEFLKRYRPQLKKLSAQYGAAILDGHFDVLLTSSIDSDKNLIVKDIIGPFVVYTPDRVSQQGVKIQLLNLDNFINSKELQGIDAKIEEVEENPDTFKD